MTPIGGCYNTNTPDDNTHGFWWGPLRVSRMAHIEGRGFAVGIDTDHDRIQIWVTEKGRKIRVWRGNQELAALGEDT